MKNPLEQSSNRIDSEEFIWKFPDDVGMMPVLTFLGQTPESVIEEHRWTWWWIYEDRIKAAGLTDLISSGYVSSKEIGPDCIIFKNVSKKLTPRQIFKRIIRLQNLTSSISVGPSEFRVNLVREWPEY